MGTKEVFKPSCCKTYKGIRGTKEGLLVLDQYRCQRPNGFKGKIISPELVMSSMYSTTHSTLEEGSIHIAFSLWMVSLLSPRLFTIYHPPAMKLSVVLQYQWVRLLPLQCVNSSSHYIAIISSEVSQWPIAALMWR